VNEKLQCTYKTNIIIKKINKNVLGNLKFKKNYQQSNIQLGIKKWLENKKILLKKQKLYSYILEKSTN